jgi:hypothetical protein
MDKKKIMPPTILGVFIVVGLVVLLSLNINVLAITEANPGAGKSGFLVWYAYPHQAVPATAYAANLTSSWYSYGNALSAAGTGYIPSDTTFDIVVKCRVNTSGAYNSSSSSWMTSWIKMNITCAGLSIAANTPMTIVEITHVAGFIWVHGYLNKGGVGYTITRNQVINVTSFTLQTY